jgi:hypothetical protein
MEQNENEEERLKQEYPLLLARLYEILEHTPHVMGHHGGNGAEFRIEDVVELIFDGEEAIKLMPEGRVYDYTVLAPEKYYAPTTREQIKSIIGGNGKVPQWIKYTRQSELSDSEMPTGEVVCNHTLRINYQNSEVQRRLNHAAT